MRKERQHRKRRLQRSCKKRNGRMESEYWMIKERRLNKTLQMKSKRKKRREVFGGRARERESNRKNEGRDENEENEQEEKEKVKETDRNEGKEDEK